MSHNEGHHHHRHGSSHSRDRNRRSSHGSHRDGQHHFRSHHDHNRSNHQSPYPPFQHQEFPFQPQQLQQHRPLFVNQQQYQIDNQHFDHPPMPAMFQMQPSFPQPPHMMPFDQAPMHPPPTNMSIPNLPFQAGATIFLNEQSISASALERLQLPQDKITETGIIPNNPYYELSAGLMVPLVPASRNEYKPINPEDLRLPFPKFPDENFLRMIDSFYSRDADKRDSDGWDRNFIDTYLKQKEALSKMQTELST